MASLEDVYIVGVGQTKYEKKTDKHVIRLLWEAADLALQDAGLSWHNVDGLGQTCFTLAPENITTLAEHFGIECKFLFQGLYGGASGIIGMHHAARAIQNGDADCIVIVAADCFNVDSHMSMVRSAGQQDYMGVWGYGAANGVFAMQTREYMKRYGVTAEDFGRLCISFRKNAQLNPNALLRSDMSMEDYLNARLIADPLRLYDCVLPCCGSDAIVLVSEKIANKLNGPKSRILAANEIHNYPANDIYDLTAGWETFSTGMWEKSNYSPNDMDFVQVYDDYPVMCFLQLEGMGFAKKGEAYKLFKDRDCTVKGDFPINTGGGQLSAGQCGASGGMIGLTEAIFQLHGKAGERQIPNCKRGVVSGYGAVSYGRGLSASACILESV